MGGFFRSAVSQKLSGHKVNWKKSVGEAVKGAVIGATQGAMVASGVKIPGAVANAANFIAGTVGSAAEQGISRGRVSIGRSILGGIDNMIGNSRYGTDPLKNLKNATVRGMKAGAANAGLGYFADLVDPAPRLDVSGAAGLMAGMAGSLLMRDPRRCGSPSPFHAVLGYSMAKGYQYGVSQTGFGKRKKPSLKGFIGETMRGAVTGGVTSAAFYGAGKGIDRLWNGFRAGKGDIDSARKYYQVTSNENAQAILNSDSPTLKGREFKEVYVWTEQPTLEQAKNSGARYLDTVIEFETSATFSKDKSMKDSSLWDIAMRSDRPGPITISKVVETGFKESKRWWQFWKK